MEEKFRNKIVIVTGAASGIGRACALGFAHQGALVCLVDKDKEGLAQTGVQIAAIGMEHSEYIVDVGVNAEVHACVQAIITSHAAIDIVINNAGMNAPGSIEHLDEQLWDIALSVNLKSVYSFCHEAWPYLKKQNKSAIVNMSSVMGLVGGAGAPAYSSAKAGVLMLTRCLAKDGAKDGIRVNAVCPGYIDTPILRQGFEMDPNFEALKQQVMDDQPMGRIGTPEEVATLVLFLASEDASYISGTSITIDGALSATQIDG